MYLSGLGVPKDYVKALSWLQKAAALGDGTAESQLGAMYLTGLGVPKDYVQALAWYRKAADQGDANAESQVGDSYYYGQGGVPQDYVQALVWYRKAADQGEVGRNARSDTYICTGKEFKKTTRKLSLGIKKRPLKGRQWRRASLATCTRMVWAYHKTIRKHSLGIRRQRTGVMPLPAVTFSA